MSEHYRLAIESQYNQFILNNFGSNEMLAEIIISACISAGLYWVLGLLYFILDATQKPKSLVKYKIQPNSSQVSGPSLVKLIKQVLFNQTLAILLVSSGVWFKHRYFEVQKYIPSASQLICEFVVFILVEEVLFYYSHRALHHPALYRHIHKRHHEWQTPIAIVAMYCHPLEHLVSNVIPVFVGKINFKCKFLFYLFIYLFLNFRSHFNALPQSNNVHLDDNRNCGNSK